MTQGKDDTSPPIRQRTAYHAILLGGMAMITSAFIVIGDRETHAAIELRKAEDMKQSLSQVVPPEIHSNDLLKDVVQLKIDNKPKKFYIARSNSKTVAVAFEITAYGYAGAIEVMVGINPKGELLGARVLSHNETPGLGDKIEAGKSRWIFAFKGLSLTNPGESKWKVKKDGGIFDQFSGATITPRGVVKGIKHSLEIFRAHKAELLANRDSEPKKSLKQSSQEGSESSQRNAENTGIRKFSGAVSSITATVKKTSGKSSRDNSAGATHKG